jgi:hypothetical protein
MSDPTKTELPQTKPAVKDLLECRLPIRKWQQSILPKLNGFSASMDSIVPAKSFVKDLPDLISSNESVLLC